MSNPFEVTVNTIQLGVERTPSIKFWKAPGKAGEHGEIVMQDETKVTFLIFTDGTMRWTGYAGMANNGRRYLRYASAALFIKALERRLESVRVKQAAHEAMMAKRAREQRVTSKVNELVRPHIDEAMALFYSEHVAKDENPPTLAVWRACNVHEYFSADVDPNGDDNEDEVFAWVKFSISMRHKGEAVVEVKVDGRSVAHTAMRAVAMLEAIR